MTSILNKINPNDTSLFLYTKENKFLLTKNLSSFFGEFIDILNDHYEELCKKILDVDPDVCLVYIIDDKGNIIYGISKNMELDSLKMHLTSNIHRFQLDEYTLIVAFKNNAIDDSKVIEDISEIINYER